MADTSRVAMLWPADLKEQCKTQLGDRTLTEFVIEAVRIYLETDASLKSSGAELDEARRLAQTLSDQLVLAVDSPEKRMQALLEVQFPTWIETAGWPTALAERVHPEPAGPPQVGDQVPFQIAQPAKPIPEEIAPPVAVEPEPEPEPEPIVEPAKPVEVWTPGTARRGGDLFEKVMAKTGGALSDVPGLTIASQIDPPAMAVQEEESGLYVDDDDQALETLEAGFCPQCGGELIDGECWTCG